jgi:hypothetical protein
MTGFMNWKRMDEYKKAIEALNRLENNREIEEGDKEIICASLIAMAPRKVLRDADMVMEIRGLIDAGIQPYATEGATDARETLYRFIQWRRNRTVTH